MHIILITSLTHTGRHSISLRQRSRVYLLSFSLTHLVRASPFLQRYKVFHNNWSIEEDVAKYDEETFLFFFFLVNDFVLFFNTEGLR